MTLLALLGDRQDADRLTAALGVPVTVLLLVLLVTRDWLVLERRRARWLDVLLVVLSVSFLLVVVLRFRALVL